MRRAGFALASFLTTSLALAQPPVPGAPQPPVARPVGQPQPPAPQPAPAAPVDAVTMAHLKGWEKAMADVKTFAVKATMTLTDKATERSEKFTGDIWCMAPNRTRLNLVKELPPNVKPTGEEFTAYICNGKLGYYYDGAAKTVTVAKLGPNGAGNNLLLDIMAGMTAENALARFDIRAMKPNDPKDQYLYLELKPKFKEDAGEFEVMQLILIPPTVPGGRAYLPRRVKVTKPGGQKIEMWDFPDPQVNPKGIEEKDFLGVKPPAGWKVQQVDVPTAQPPKASVAPVKK